MEKETLETITQRLDRLEKIVVELNQKLSSVVEKVATNPLRNCETTTANVTEVQEDEQNDNIGAKAIEKILARMGYPSDFKPRPLKEVHKSMVESGIRPEDNEFSRAIIAEREK